jgi:type IV pilus biogenesis protein PilP
MWPIDAGRPRNRLRAAAVLAALAAGAARAETPAPVPPPLATPAPIPAPAAPSALDTELTLIQRELVLKEAQARKLKQETERLRQEAEFEKSRRDLELLKRNPLGLPPLPAPGAAPLPPALVPLPGPRPGPTGAADQPWLPIAIVGVDGRWMARLRARTGEVLADAAPGDVLPDSTEVAAIAPSRVTFARGASRWTLGVYRYARDAFDREAGGGRPPAGAAGVGP